MLDIKKICVSEEATLRKATELLDESGRQIILIVDGYGRLRGTFTDGDLRRALLKGGNTGINQAWLACMLEWARAFVGRSVPRARAHADTIPRSQGWGMASPAQAGAELGH